MKLFIYDTETTGISLKINDIWQIAGVIEEDGKIIDGINLQFRPNNIESLSDEILTLSRLTKQEFSNMPDRYESFSKLITFLKKHSTPDDRLTPCGYNIGFDIGFMQKLFAENKTSTYNKIFEFHFFDILALVNSLVITGQITPDNIKLETIARYFGINVDKTKTHDAMYDIKITKKLMDIINSRITFT